MTLAQVAGDLRVPFFVWTVTNGLHRYGLPNAIYDSQHPLKRSQLADAAVVRKCLDLAPAFGHDRRVIVLSAVKVELPAELEPLTARLTLALPDADELKRVVTRSSRRSPTRLHRVRGGARGPGSLSGGTRHRAIPFASGVVGDAVAVTSRPRLPLR
jgi:hypothetical protein